MSVGDKLLKAAAGGASDPVYVDDVFSTLVRTGTGGSPTIVNNIDLAGEGGLVWVKSRSQSYDHNLFDTERGTSKKLTANSNGAEGTIDGVTAFNSNGFTLGDSPNVDWNDSSFTYCYWTFRKQENFFDIVTYTGNGNNPRNISHNLGGQPGMVIVKRVDSSDNWCVWHRKAAGYGETDGYYQGRLDDDVAFGYSTVTGASSTTFTVNANAGVNQNGGSYIAYIFAHHNNDGEFGENSDEDIIKCGGYTGTGSDLSIDLGFEPQWILFKKTNGTADWVIRDSMRGTTDNFRAELYPNSSDAEYNHTSGTVAFTPTGFRLPIQNGTYNTNGDKFIYVAIRRPHKPASEFAATDLFDITLTSQDNTAVQTSLNRTDFNIQKHRGDSTFFLAQSRLTGNLAGLRPSGTDAESNYSSSDPRGVFDTQGKVKAYTGSSNVIWSWMRAKGFFDVVTYSATGSANLVVNHNLGVAPEVVLVKKRSGSANWAWSSGFGGTLVQTEFNQDATASSSKGYVDSVTSTTFTTGGSGAVISSGDYIAYLFASVNGISKVGSYTGTGNDVNVDCGFSSGARFVLVKCSTSDGHWYLWDAERGIVAGNDPYLYILYSRAEVTNTDYIDPLSSGFTITSSAPADINNSGDTYIFYAIA